MQQAGGRLVGALALAGMVGMGVWSMVEWPRPAVVLASGAVGATDASPAPVRPVEPQLALQAPSGPVRATAAAPRPVAPVHLTLDMPRSVEVGATIELTLAVAPGDGNASGNGSASGSGNGSAGDIGRIAFSVQVDANLLQVRGAQQGAWSAIAQGVYDATVSIGDDRVDVRTTVSGGRAGRAGGSVATIELQAMAPGGTTVLVSDVSLIDATGRLVPHALAGSSLQVTIGPPTPRPVTSANETSASTPTSGIDADPTSGAEAHLVAP